MGTRHGWQAEYDLEYMRFPSLLRSSQPEHRILREPLRIIDILVAVVAF